MSDLERLRAALPASQLDRLKAMTPQSGPDRAQRAPVLARAEVLEPVTLQAIAAVLDSVGANYEADDEGDLYGSWDEGYFYFYAPGEADTNAVQVQGAWSQLLSADQFGEALVLVNEWNANQPLPTAFVVHDEDDDTVQIFSEHTVDFGPGATFEQLSTVIMDGIGGGVAIFEAAAEMFAEQDVSTDDGSIEP